MWNTLLLYFFNKSVPSVIKRMYIPWIKIFQRHILHHYVLGSRRYLVGSVLAY